jgi:multidrug efflux pump subunit AcrA (membrane-fusion protein)
MRNSVALKRGGSIGSLMLVAMVVLTAAGLAAWKYVSIRKANAAAAGQSEPIESVAVAVAREREHRATTTSIGTVLALRSISLRNELPGIVREVALTPGQVVDAGTVLVALDASVEEAELEAQEAQAADREGSPAHVSARVVAIDARIDPTTRNAMVRARIEGADNAPAPSASVRVRTPVGPPGMAVAIPVSALRKGPGGDHVFVIAPDKEGKTRAQLRHVYSGTMLDDEVLIHSGLSAGEQVAASGSFKLREAVLVAVATNTETAGNGSQ